MHSIADFVKRTGYGTGTLEILDDRIQEWIKTEEVDDAAVKAAKDSLERHNTYWSSDVSNYCCRHLNS